MKDHDSLCLMSECIHPDPNGGFKATCGYCFGYCQCDLIAKVRADERHQESARRMSKFGYWHDYRPELP